MELKCQGKDLWPENQLFSVWPWTLQSVRTALPQEVSALRKRSKQTHPSLYRKVILNFFLKATFNKDDGIIANMLKKKNSPF